MKSLLRLVVLLALVSGIHLGSAEAAPLQQCLGECRLRCIGSPTSYLWLTAGQCCAEVANCPNESGFARWFPGSGAACSGQVALVCA